MTPSSLLQNVSILKLNDVTVTNRIYTTEEIEKTIKKIPLEGISGTLGRPFPNTESQGPDDYINIPVEKISHIAHTFKIEELAAHMVQLGIHKLFLNGIRIK